MDTDYIEELENKIYMQQIEFEKVEAESADYIAELENTIDSLSEELAKAKALILELSTQ